MPNEQQHTIQSQILDVTLRERGLVHSVQETLSGLSRRRLLAETEAVFSQVSDAERRLRIDRLEVDLGTLSFDRLEEDFLEKYRPALWNALTAWVESNRSTPAYRAASGQPAGTLLELLAHLLLHGSAPWWWSAPGGRSLEAIVGETLEKTPEELERLVRRVGPEALVRRRMVLQLADPCLEALLRLLEPANAEFTILYGRNLRREQEETKFVAATRREFRDVTWEVILQYLLVERGSDFNTRSFLRSTIRGLAQRFRLTYRALLAHLVSAVVPESRLPRPHSLQVLLQTLEREDSPEADREGWPRGDESVRQTQAREAGQESTSRADPGVRQKLGREDASEAGREEASDRSAPQTSPGKGSSEAGREGSSRTNKDELARLAREGSPSGGGEGEARAYRNALETLAREDLPAWAADAEASRLWAIDQAAAGGSPELWAQFEEAWQAQNNELIPPLWSKILCFTSAARAAQMLVSRFAPASWESLLRVLGRGTEAGVLAAVARLEAPASEATGAPAWDAESWQAFREQLWRSAFERTGDSAGNRTRWNRGDWTALLRRALGQLGSAEQRAAVVAGWAEAGPVSSEAPLAEAVRELTQSHSTGASSPAALAALVLQHFLTGTPSPGSIAQAWWDYPTAWRRAVWERILLAAAPPARIAQWLISSCAPAAWPAVLHSMTSGAEPAELAALEAGLRELHRGGMLRLGPWEAVRAKLWLAVFEMAAGALGVRRPWRRSDWLVLVSRFLPLAGPETGLPELLAALSMAPALARQTTLTRALQDAAVFASRPGFPLELATLQAAPELALGVLATFARTGTIVPPGALSLLPGGPEALLIRLATLQPATLILLLRRLAAQPQELSGLVARFSATALGALLRAVAPREGHLILSYLTLLIEQRTALLTPAGQGERWRRSVWLAMLEIVAAQRDASPGAAAAIRAHVEAMARRQGIARSTLATRLWRLVRRGSPAALKELARLFASMRSPSQRAAGGDFELSGADEELPSPAVLKQSVTARIALWRTLLPGAATPAHGAAIEPRLRQLWTSGAHDPLSLYREELAGIALEPRAVEVVISTGGESFFLQVVTSQSPGWISEFREWLDFLDRLPGGSWLFPFPRREIRARLLAGLGDLFRTPPSRLLSPSAVMLELLVRAGVYRHVAKSAAAPESSRAWRGLETSDWRTAPETQVVAFLLLAAAESGARTPAPRMVQALKIAAAPLRAAVAERRAKAAPRTVPPRPTPPQPPKRPTPQRPREPAPSYEGPWFIDNAGLVLLAPFFPRYHQANGLLEEGRFRDAAAAERAVLLLQLLLGSERLPFEHTLVLNKVLCGLALETPVAASLEPREGEMQNVELLLRSALQNWPAAANLSLDGFRNSFLWREGKLERKESSWRLTVQTRGFDVLLGSLPWGFSTIKPAWMPEPLYVEWA